MEGSHCPKLSRCTRDRAMSTVRSSRLRLCIHFWNELIFPKAMTVALILEPFRLESLSRMLR